jgi:Transposase zinc-ribbon domain
MLRTEYGDAATLPPRRSRKDALSERHCAQEEAHAKFDEIRWADNHGQPYCPECGCLKVYALSIRKLWKCAGCRYQP